jgi:hypothetical protein
MHAWLLQEDMRTGLVNDEHYEEEEEKEFSQAIILKLLTLKSLNFLLACL